MRFGMLALALFVGLFLSPRLFATPIVWTEDPVAPGGHDGALLLHEFTVRESSERAGLIVVGRGFVVALAMAVMLRLHLVALPVLVVCPCTGRLSRRARVICSGRHVAVVHVRWESVSGDVDR